MTIRHRLARLWALVRASRLDRELDGEIQAHLEMAERDALARGLSPDDARRDARRRFGGIAQLREVHRDDRSARWIETSAKDFRYGLLSLLRHRAFAAVAIGVLALGIGATTTMFSLVDSVLLRPLPYPDPERIVRIWEAPTPTTVNQTTNGFFHEWRRRSISFEAMAAERPTHVTVTIGGEPVRLSGVLATSDYFHVFGVHAAIGRTFASADDRVIVLSHAAWQIKFGGDPNILTRDLIVDDRAYRVIGVLPVGSFDREPTRSGPNEIADFWMPLVFTADDLSRGEHQNDVVARLHAGVTLPRAQQDMIDVRASLADITPASEGLERRRQPFDLGSSATGSRLVAELRRRHRGAVDHVRQHRQPAPRERRAASARKWLCVPHSVPVVVGWSLNSSPRPCALCHGRRRWHCGRLSADAVVSPFLPRTCRRAS